MNKRAYAIDQAIATELFEEAIRLATFIRVDHIQEGSARRTPANKGIGWAMENVVLSKGAHIRCYERQGFSLDDYDYFEFSASTMNALPPEYFLWVHVPVADGEQLVSKYNLKSLR